ncbi:MAG: hypothetical protein AAFY76_25150, partial [Cyanobacteria bacterium J06649_11]
YFFSLEEAVDYWLKGLTTDILQRPFLHTKIFKSFTDSNDIIDLERREANGELTIEEMDELIEIELVRGSLVLKRGDRQDLMLVITGPARGQMWMNNDYDDLVYEPLKLTFLEWFEDWLDFYLKRIEI